MVELMLMLPLIAIVIMFLLISYDLVEEHIRLQVAASAALREQILQVDGASFREVSGEARGATRIEGRMAQYLGRSVVPVHLRLDSYAGSCQGLYRNRYRRSDYRYDF